MVTFEWIRKTFAPPIVATVIAISLVSGGGSEKLPDSVVTPNSMSITTSL